jgi:hypothetical protein
MAEAEDWQKALIDESLYLRGRFVASYSQVEFLLADISVKLDQKFHYQVKNRVKAARNIGERPQFAAYKNELNAICDELATFEEMRHFLAHGFLTLHVDMQKQHQFQYRMYKHEDDTFVQMGGATTIERLREAVKVITAFVERAMALFRKIYFEQNLEPQ